MSETVWESAFGRIPKSGAGILKRSLALRLERPGGASATKEVYSMVTPTDFKGILVDVSESVEWDKSRRLTSFTYKHQFLINTRRDLARIARMPLGADLLGLIGKRHDGIGTSAGGEARTVTIVFRPSSESPGAATAAMGLNNRFRVTRRFAGQPFGFAGQGSATKIRMHNDAGSEAIYTRLTGVATPPWIVLAHELIHALHHLSGTTYRESAQTPGGEVKREEMWTTGLGAYANTRLSENAIRAEAGLPPRTFYTFVDDHAHMPSLSARMAMPRPGFWYCACLQDRFGAQ